MKEPSINDHGAPWNEATDDENGTYCDCTECRAARRKVARDERRDDAG